MKRFLRLVSIAFSIVGGMFFPVSTLAYTDITANITQNTTWTTASSTYVIRNPITINSGITLTINPGVVVKFATTSPASIQVNGILNATGVSTSTISFTSINDNTVGNTIPGSNGNPQAGNWKNITTATGATTTLKYATVRYGGASVSGVLNHSGGITTIATSTISNNSNYGIYASNSGTILITGSTFSGNPTAAGYFDLGSGLVLTNSGNTATSTGLRGFIMTGAMSSNQTWQADTIPYIVSSSGLTVSATKTLTINPGAVVKFETSLSQLIVNGTLNAQGTANSKIYFTSIADDVLNDTNGTTTLPVAGNWNNIVTQSGGNTTLNYATVRYGGTTNVYNNGGTLNFNNSTSTSASQYGIYHAGGITTIATSTMNSNGNYGVYGFGSGTTTVQNSKFFDNSTAAGYFSLGIGNGLILQNSGNTASGTGLRGFIMSGTISQSQTWNSDTIPYIIPSGGLTVPSGKKLTINPNTVVKFESTASILAVNGELSAIGTPTSQISFTSINDDILNDTNGTTTLPSAGNWQRIETGNGATTTLKYTNVKYGGYFNGWMLQIWGGVMTISHSEIATSTTYSIYQSGGTLTVADFSDIHGQQYGIYATGGTGKLAVTSSDIHANTYGIYTSAASTTVDVSKLYGNSYGFYVAGGTSNWITSSELYNNLEGVRVAGGSANIASNSIHGNTTYGVNNTTGVDVHAEYNYWGAANGPSGVGPGSGDAITVKVLWNPFLDQAHYLNINGFGKPNNSVDKFKGIDWNWSATSPVTSTSTQSAWYYAVGTWNALGQITIATTTGLTIQDLTVSSTTRPDASWGAQWANRSISSNPDTIELNAYQIEGHANFPAFNSAQKKFVTMHELGHALGLGHSTSTNVMYYTLDTTTPTTTLGTQDISDYTYCWQGSIITAKCLNPQ